MPWRAIIVLFLSALMSAQEKTPPPDGPVAQTKSDAINVNWLYGAYVPKEVPLEPLTAHQRGKLYLRQTYLTWGIYLKTGFFAIGDQVGNSPPEWGSGIGGYGKRMASRYGQFAIQNTLSSGGNYLLGYEPRYERCRCSGTWPRIGHALARNFITYNRTETERRPQLAMYGGAMGAGMVASTWKPGGKKPWVEGYQSMVTQAAFGSFANIIGEFAPEIGRLLKRKKKAQLIMKRH
jgi:hypothetical protein